MDGPVTETWAVDAEWGFRGENRTDFESAWEPVILCLVGLTSGRRLSYWGRDGRLPAFFREHSRDLFISHYSIAELKFLSRLGIELPERWVDTFVEYRRSTNRPSPPKAGLSNALYPAWPAPPGAAHQEAVAAGHSPPQVRSAIAHGSATHPELLLLGLRRLPGPLPAPGESPTDRDGLDRRVPEGSREDGASRHPDGPSGGQPDRTRGSASART